jgi:putative methionine-R-sulfoxide reductase with GAF domain
MQAEKGSVDTLRAIVDAAIHVVPGARWAGISLIEGKKVVPEAPTDPIVAKLDELQSELGTGPCISAIRDHHTVRVDDMSLEKQWPEFTRQALELGVRSLLSFQLFVNRDNLGAINLYGSEVEAFTEESVEAGAILAQHAAVAMRGEAAEAEFRTGLASRDVIGQAKGMLMERNGITAVQAFAMLTKVSQEVNMKLVDVARWLVSEHEDAVTPPETCSDLRQ